MTTAAIVTAVILATLSALRDDGGDDPDDDEIGDDLGKSFGALLPPLEESREGEADRDGCDDRQEKVEHDRGEVDLKGRAFEEEAKGRGYNKGREESRGGRESDGIADVSAGGEGEDVGGHSAGYAPRHHDPDEIRSFEVKALRDAKGEGRHGEVLDACPAENFWPLLRDGFDFVVW